MSGIFGLWRLDGRPVAPATLQEISESLAHRGPDGAATWSDESVGLGHRMFHVTPESLRESQPVAAPNGDLVLVADARLDNRAELVSELRFRERLSEAITDADLLLASYECWGDRCAERLIGDFAFAVWDARRRALVCVRDHFGVKSLYYFHAPGQLFAFASEVQALLALPEVPEEINEREVARHLLIPLGRDVSSTYYRYVQRLSPGHTLTASDGGLEQRAYWQLDPTRELKLRTDDEYAEALREVFVEAVRSRLRSITPVASMLSGGLDSASITCVAARLLDDSGGGRLHTLSAEYPEVPETDERAFIDEVLERHDVIPHFFEADQASPIAEIDRMNSLVGGASWGANLYLNWELCRIAADAGARVVLDGHGGDITVSLGTAYLSELAISGKWLKLALAAIPYSRRQGLSPIADYLALVRFGLRRRLQGTAGATLVRRIRKGVSARSVEKGSSAAWRLVINEDFARQISDSITPAPESPLTEREMHARMLNSEVLLEALGWIEACGAGRGVEVRFPFFDVRVVELCLSFPSDQKLRRGWTRFAMRRAMEGILPPRIQWRPTKTDLAHGWAYAYRSRENGRFDALLAHPDPRVKRYIDIERLRKLHERYMAGEASGPEGRALWRALSLALWLTGSLRHGPRSAR